MDINDIRSIFDFVCSFVCQDECAMWRKERNTKVERWAYKWVKDQREMNQVILLSKPNSFSKVLWKPT